MSEIWIEGRHLARLVSVVVMLMLASGLVAPRALGQTPAPVPAPTAPATPPPAGAPAPAATAKPVAPPPTPATPPPAPTKEQLAEAKKFFEAGMKLSKEGLYQEALASFLEANRISPRESIQNNLARTYRLMKDMASAYDAYETLLTKYGDKMKPALKSEAQHALEELEVLTGVVSIGVQEPDAKVAIDAKEVGVTPLAKPVRVNIGTHQVTIVKDGFDTISQQVELRGHDTAAVNGPLTKTVLTGRVSVTVTQTTPPDPTVKVLIDGKEVGSPPYQGDLDPGMHTIEAKGNVDVATPKPLQVEKKGIYAENLELHAQQGSIAVNVDVADSEIAIDDHVVAHGVFEGPLSIGTHLLAVTKAGFAQYKKELIVHDGEKVVENVALQREGPVGPVKPPHDWTGVYSQLNFVGQFEVTTPTNDVSQGVGYSPSTTISGTAPYGGGLNVRVGYSLGFIGIEGSILLGFDHSSVTATVNNPGSGTVTHPYTGTVPNPVTENYDFFGFGGTAGLGVRLMPKTQVVRPTLGVGGGATIKGSFYDRSIPGTGSDFKSDPTFIISPALMIDGGVELGSTPGTRFYLGCLMIANFSGATAAPTKSFNDATYPAPTTLNLVNGTDVFIGPILGMQFGE